MSSGVGEYKYCYKMHSQTKHLNEQIPAFLHYSAVVSFVATLVFVYFAARKIEGLPQLPSNIIAPSHNFILELSLSLSSSISRPISLSLVSPSRSLSHSLKDSIIKGINKFTTGGNTQFMQNIPN